MSGCPVAFHETKEYATCTSPIMHLICFSFLLRGITAVLREIENNAYAKFWGELWEMCKWRIIMVLLSHNHKSIKCKHTFMKYRTLGKHLTRY